MRCSPIRCRISSVRSAGRRAGSRGSATRSPIGRTIDPLDTQPHGFVGARFLDSIGLHDIAPLVAHHSAARFEAEARGMSHFDRWHVEDPALLHLLTLLDRTTDGRGRRVGLAERRADNERRRHGRHSRQARNFDASLADVRAGLALLGGRAPLIAG